METDNTFQHKSPYKTTDTTPGSVQYALDQISALSNMIYKIIIIKNNIKLSV